MIDITVVEVWIPYEKYWVSSIGRVQNKHGRMMTTNSRFINLSGKMYRVKNLVAKLFMNTKKNDRVYWINPDKGDGVNNLYIKK